jgi:hypothetical protein
MGMIINMCINGSSDKWKHLPGEKERRRFNKTYWNIIYLSNDI